MKKFPYVCSHVLIAGSLAFAGCSGGSNKVPLPSFDPEDSASKAMELHDANGDGVLSGEELDGAPGLKAAMKNLDADGDGQINAEDIADRIRAWEEQRVGLMSITAEVTMNGQPLSGATVTLEPEPFLGDAVKTAVGETGMAGTFRPRVPKEQRPSPDSPPGIQAGFFRVKISKQQGGKEMIPAQYNSETTLGLQVAKDDYRIMNKQVVYNLKSK